MSSAFRSGVKIPANRLGYLTPPTAADSGARFRFAGSTEETDEGLIEITATGKALGYDKTSEESQMKELVAYVCELGRKV